MQPIFKHSSGVVFPEKFVEVMSALLKSLKSFGFDPEGLFVTKPNTYSEMSCGQVKFYAYNRHRALKFVYNEGVSAGLVCTANATFGGLTWTSN